VDRVACEGGADDATISCSQHDSTMVAVEGGTSELDNAM
jgi:hypothetical protein